MAYGLKPTRSLLSATWADVQNKYYIASGYNTDLFTGDPVYVTGTGTIIRATAGAGNPITGVFLGCKYTAVTQGINGNQVFSPYWAAGTVTFQAANAEAMICDDPNTIFAIQSNGAGVAAADLYNNADLAAGAGSILSGQSGFVLDVATIGNGPTKQLKILDIIPMPGNLPGAAANYVWVKLNQGFFQGAVVGGTNTGTAGV